jgi:hypothetical protein
MMIRAHPSGSEEKAARVLLEDIHRQVSAAIARIDAGLAEIRERKRLLTDEAFRAQIRAETRAWFKHFILLFNFRKYGMDESTPTSQF